MRSQFVFTVVMMSGMLVASALLSLQLDKVYAQSTDPNAPPQQVDFAIATQPPCQREVRFGFVTKVACEPSDAVTTLNPPFNSNFALKCTIDGRFFATCVLDFVSPDLNGNDWDVTCYGGVLEVPSARVVSITGCIGTLDDENHS